MKILQGWIFRVYASGLDTVVQTVDTDERVHQLLDRFTPAFYVGGEPQECRALARFILEQRWDVKLSYTEQFEPSLNHSVHVLRVEVENPHHFSAILQRVRNFKPKLTYPHGVLSLSHLYLWARQIQPLALCHFAIDQENRILGIECCASITSPPSRDNETGGIKGESIHGSVFRRGVIPNARPEPGLARSTIRARRVSVVKALGPRRETKRVAHADRR